MRFYHFFIKAVGSQNDKTFIFGTSKGLEGNNREAGKSTHKDTELLKAKVLKQFKLECERRPLNGPKYGAWKSVPVASKALYEQFVLNGPRLQREGKQPSLLLNKENGPKTIENWLYDMIGAEKKQTKPSGRG